MRPILAGSKLLNSLVVHFLVHVKRMGRPYAIVAVLCVVKISVELQLRFLLFLVIQDLLECLV